jgi:hypothetical protein
MGRPLRRLPISRVVPFLPVTECVSPEHELALPSDCEAGVIVVSLLSLYGFTAILLYLM